MSCGSDQGQSLLGEWPPLSWTEGAEELSRWPGMSLRRELLMSLDAIHRSAVEGAFPAAPINEIMDLLNEVGTPLDVTALPLVEAVLEGLWREGLIGAVPAPTPHEPKRYMSRESAMVALRWNAPVMLLPLADGAAQKIYPTGQQEQHDQRRDSDWRQTPQRSKG